MRPYRSHPPSADSYQSQPTSGAATVAKISSSAETLLVVDDDPMVREVVTQVLLLKGYTVLQAQGAAEAMQLAGETEKIHLLITDFSMPEVDGLELSRQFRAVHPKTPVLMVSGSLPLVRDGTRDLDRVELLAKPFAFAEFLHKVRTLLDAAVLVSRRKPWSCD